MAMVLKNNSFNRKFRYNMEVVLYILVDSREYYSIAIK